MNKFILICILISGCSWFSYSSFSYQGFSVYNRQADTNMNHSQMMTIINHAVNNLNNREVLVKYDIVFTSAWLGRPRIDGKIDIADGYTDIENKVIYIKVRECIWDTALIHEMAHIIQYEVHEIIDINHEVVSFWNKVYELENSSIEFCPKNYVRVLRNH